MRRIKDKIEGSITNADYASSAGSATTATTASKLGTNAGSVTQPVYFKDGVPVTTTYALNKTVPADAKFTDTNTWRGIQNNLTSAATDQSLAAAQGKWLNENKTDQRNWTASVKCATWSRLCYIPYAMNNYGSSFILNIAASRASVVYNETFVINVNHNKKATIVKVGTSLYSSIQLRIVEDSSGNCYVELNDNANSATNATSQNVICRLICIRTGTPTLYTAFTDGTTLPTNFSQTASITTNTNSLQGNLTWSEITGKPSTFTPASHTHDDRYYTETEADSRFYRGDLSRTKNTVLAAPNGSDGKATFRKLTTADVPDASTMINTLTTGTAAPQDADYYVCQYAGGGTTTTTYHRRPMSSLWSYIKSKAESVFAPKSHTHTKSQITDFPASLKNPYALTVQTNGTTAATYDGSAAKTVNVTKASIGLGNVENTKDADKTVKSAGSAGKLSTARTVSGGTDVTLNFNYDGSANSTANIGFYSCSAQNGNTNNYLFHRFAKLDTITGSYTDKTMTVYITQDYNGGGFGICRLSLRTNSSTATSSVEAKWLMRSGLPVDFVQVAIYNVYGKTYADAFLKLNGTYANTTVRAVASGNRGSISRTWTLVSSKEVGGTTADDKKTSIECWKTIADAATDLHSQAYSASASAIDSGTVNNAASATTASSCTGNAATATTASKIGTATVGSATRPVYINAGVPTAGTYTLGNASTKTIRTLTAAGPSGWNNVSTDQKYIPDMAFMAYWNGAYSGTSSNLTYCNKGTFGTAATANKTDFATAGHTHNYAGAASSGGSATSAVKLDTSAGGATQPIYFKDGKPVATTYALNKTVPVDAKFTDTTYGDMKGASTASAGTAGLVPAPTAGAATRYLRSDGSWQVPPNTWRGIQNSLTSNSTTDSLSAAQGKNLKTLVDAKLPLSGGTMTGPIEFSNGSESIYSSGNDAANGSGDALNNLVISSWNGISFTPSQEESVYYGKTAVGIDCRNSTVKAKLFQGYLDGIARSTSIDEEKFVDLTALNQNTWYPVMNEKIPYNGMHRIKCSVMLGSFSKPSWSTHEYGFTALVDLLVTANGWGSCAGNSICLQNDQCYINDSNNPPVGYQQLDSSSRPCFWLRGGGKYRLYDDIGYGAWDVHTSTYTENGESVEPTTSYPGINIHRSAISTNIMDLDGKHQVLFNINDTRLQPDDDYWVLAHTNNYSNGFEIRDINLWDLKKSVVVSSGSKYARFFDGTQICWGPPVGTSCDGTTIYFDVAFASTPAVTIVGCKDLDDVYFVTDVGKTSFVADKRGYAGGYASWIAVGRWK